MRKVGIFLVLFLVMFSFCSYGFDLGNYTGPIVFIFDGWNVRRQYKYDSKQNLWIPEEGARSGLAESKQESLSEGDYSSDGVADRWGIINVVAICTVEDSKWQPFWYPSGEEEITGVAWGFDDAWIKSEESEEEKTITVLQKGGYIALYLDTTPDFNHDVVYSDDSMPDNWVASGPELSWDPWKATDGTLFLLLEAVKGISTEHPSATRSVFFKENLLFPFEGDGIALFDVIGGAYARMFDSNVYDIDIVVEDAYSGYYNVYPPFDSYGVGYIYGGYVIPEPGSLSLSLLGAGLILILNKRKPSCRKN